MSTKNKEITISLSIQVIDGAQGKNANQSSNIAVAKIPQSFVYVRTCANKLKINDFKQSVTIRILSR